MASGSLAPPPVDPQDGVIEDARRRQRRRRRAAAAAVAAVVVMGIVVAALSGGSGRPRPKPAGSGPVSFAAGTVRVGGAPFAVSVTPSLAAGTVALCVTTEAAVAEGCDDPYPGTPGAPLTESEGNGSILGLPGATIVTFVVAPNVAAVRLLGAGVSPTWPAPGLPPGDRLAVAYQPFSAIRAAERVASTSLSPTRAEQIARQLLPVALDAGGHVVPGTVHTSPSTQRLAALGWGGGAVAPDSARCLAAATPSLGFLSAESVARITPTPTAPPTALLSCFHGSWVLPNTRTVDAAILLDARAPRAPAPSLWDAVPVPGRPGIVEIPPVTAHLTAAQLVANRRALAHVTAGSDVQPPVLGSNAPDPPQLDVGAGIVARRVGDAWLVVTGAGGVADDLRALDALRVTRLEIGG